MWPCNLKLDQEKWKRAILVQQNGFGPAFLHHLLRLGKGTAKPNTCPEKSVINMIWLLLPISYWPIIMVASGGLLLVVSHLFAAPVLVYGWGWKKVNNHIWMWEIFLQGHILSTTGDALTEKCFKEMMVVGCCISLIVKVRTHAYRKAHENIDNTLKAAESVLTQFDVSRQVCLIFFSFPWTLHSKCMMLAKENEEQ